jgi:CBS domain-containing protein
MSEHNIGRLLVVDENDTSLLLGILTRSDVMQAFRKNVATKKPV